jgi:putative membrane protein (TIGR04086 family)
MRKNEEEQGAKLISVMTRVLLSGVVGLLFCLVFLMICSVGISTGILKESFMYQLTVIGCVVGGFSGGLLAVSRCRSRTLIVGLAVGVVFLLLLLTVGVLFFESLAPGEGGLGLLCGALCGGAASGILGGKPKKKHR